MITLARPATLECDQMVVVLRLPDRRGGGNSPRVEFISVSPGVGNGNPAVDMEIAMSCRARCHAAPGRTWLLWEASTAASPQPQPVAPV